MAMEETMLEIHLELNMMEEEDGCATPRRGKCRIPEAVVCPPPPRKRTAVYYGKGSEPPKNGYFQPPDLESVFVLTPRRETCA